MVKQQSILNPFVKFCKTLFYRLDRIHIFNYLRVFFWLLLFFLLFRDFKSAEIFWKEESFVIFYNDIKLYWCIFSFQKLHWMGRGRLLGGLEFVGGFFLILKRNKIINLKVLRAVQKFCHVNLKIFLKSYLQCFSTFFSSRKIVIGKKIQLKRKSGENLSSKKISRH